MVSTQVLSGSRGPHTKVSEMMPRELPGLKGGGVGSL